MKILLLSITLAMLSISCSDRSKHAVYDMMHEKQRQDCLKKGRTDCQRAERYDNYKKKRDDIIKQ